MSKGHKEILPVSLGFSVTQRPLGVHVALVLSYFSTVLRGPRQTNQMRHA